MSKAVAPKTVGSIVLVTILSREPSFARAIHHLQAHPASSAPPSWPEAAMFGKPHHLVMRGQPRTNNLMLRTSCCQETGGRLPAAKPFQYPNPCPCCYQRVQTNP
eukprot:1655686-Amphidinium_carterae.1